MTKGVGLRELEKRLKDEPDNLGLRVTVAGALHEAGRKADAVELYRSVAIAYRDQGRTQQAIAVCRSILEIAPEDTRCSELLASLLPRAEGSQAVKAAVIPSTPVPRPPTRPPMLTPATPARSPALTPPRPVPRPEGSQTGPVRRSSMDETPLPGPLPYHVADPTTRSLKKLSEIDLPTSEGADTRPGSSGTPPPMDGLANAARRISAELIRAGESYDSLDVSAELDTRQRPKIETGELQKISRPPPAAAPAASPPSSFDDEGPPPHQESDDGVVHDTEEELTVPREIPGIDVMSPRARSSGEVTKLRGEPADPRAALLAAPFFAPLPPPRRAAVLGRFHAKTVRAGQAVIRQGESDAALVIVGSGRLEVRLERAGGKHVLVESVGAGDYIGEGALLSRTPAAAHVIAATDAELLLLLPHDFYEIAGTYPALWALLKDVAERRARDLAKLR